MVYLLPFFLFSLTTYALPPIEGGKTVPFTNTSLIDVVEIDTGSSSCTGTKVSPTLVITAAHCILSYKDNNKSMIKVGKLMGMLGIVTKVHVHPKYIEATNAYKTALKNKDINAKKIGQKATLYDLGFIQFEPKANIVSRSYPTIINKDTHFNERKNVVLAGYGNTKLSWDGNKFNHQGSDSRLRTGNNSWENCQGPLFDLSISDLETLSKKLDEFLEIKTLVQHTVIAGNESIKSLDNEAMILSGDSGSPSLEKDSLQNLIITGIASNITAYDDGSGDAEVEIEYNGKIFKEKIQEFPKDWGLKEKRDQDFPEVLAILKQHDLTDADGNIQGDVTVKRHFKRITTGRYSDLSHPENQNFIKNVMSPK